MLRITTTNAPGIAEDADNLKVFILVDGFGRLIESGQPSAGNRNLSRFQRFGHFAGQINMQHTVSMVGGADLNVLGQLNRRSKARVAIPRCK